MFAGGVFLEGDAAEAAHFPGLTGIIEVDRIFATLTQRFRKVDEDRVELSRVLQVPRSQRDAIDVQIRVQIDLDPRVVFEHLEADGVLAADEFLVRIDTNVEVVVQQIVVRSMLAVCAAQDVGSGRWP